MAILHSATRLRNKGFRKVILSPDAPLRSRTGMNSGHSRCHTKLLARSNTGSLIPKRRLEPRLQGNRFRIYCKRAYNSMSSGQTALCLEPREEYCIPVPIHPLSVPTARDASGERQSGRDWCCSASSSTIACRALLIIREVPTIELHRIRFSR